MNDQRSSAGNRIGKLALWFLPMFLVIGLTILTVRPAPLSTWLRQGRVPSLPSEKVLEIWRAPTFTPIDRSAGFENTLQNIEFHWVNSFPNTNQSVQREEAMNSVRHFLFALAFKDSNEYLEFRLPVKTFTVDQEITKYRLSILQRISKDQVDLSKLPPSEVLERWFLSKFIPLGTNGAVLYDQALGQIITGISVGESAFFIERRKTLPIALELFVAKNSPNAGVWHQHSFTSFSPAMQTSLKNNG